MWAGRQSLQEMQPGSYVPGLTASSIKFFCVTRTSGVFNQAVPQNNSKQGFLLHPSKSQLTENVQSQTAYPSLAQNFISCRTSLCREWLARRLKKCQARKQSCSALWSPIPAQISNCPGNNQLHWIRQAFSYLGLQWGLFRQTGDSKFVISGRRMNKKALSEWLLPLLVCPRRHPLSLGSYNKASWYTKASLTHLYIWIFIW